MIKYRDAITAARTADISYTGINESLRLRTPPSTAPMLRPESNYKFIVKNSLSKTSNSTLQSSLLGF